MDGMRASGEAAPSTAVSAFWQAKYRRESAKSWDCFYKRNEGRFFKDRHWISREFPELFAAPQGRRRVVLEVGCGVGNFALPLVEESEAAALMVYACDFSDHAIQLFRCDARCIASSDRCQPFVANATDAAFPAVVGEATQASPIDVVTCIFVLSALPPELHSQALANLGAVLSAQGGEGLVLFRDYAAEDAAKRRFKADRRLSESLFVRQDGTLSYFFTRDELVGLFEGAGFVTLACEHVRGRTTNVKEAIDVDRVFLQGKFAYRPAAPPSAALDAPLGDLE